MADLAVVLSRLSHFKIITGHCTEPQVAMLLLCRSLILVVWSQSLVDVVNDERFLRNQHHRSKPRRRLFMWRNVAILLAAQDHWPTVLAPLCCLLRIYEGTPQKEGPPFLGSLPCTLWTAVPTLVPMIMMSMRLVLRLNDDRLAIADTTTTTAPPPAAAVMSSLTLPLVWQS